MLAWPLEKHWLDMSIKLSLKKKKSVAWILLYNVHFSQHGPKCVHFTDEFATEVVVKGGIVIEFIILRVYIECF